MLSNYNYHCPQCDHLLTRDDKIYFFFYGNAGQKTDIILSAMPGVYGHLNSRNTHIKEGDRIDFHCPGCTSSLLSENKPEYVKIHLKICDGFVFDVLFSPICGEKVSYILMENEMVVYKGNFLRTINYGEAS